MNAPALATFWTPWGDLPLALCEHEANIDGADVMLAREAHPDCPRHLCEGCCDDRCCRLCHKVDAHDGEPLCGSCATEMAMDRAELEGEDRRVGLCCSNNCGGYCEGGVK